MPIGAERLDREAISNSPPLMAAPFGAAASLSSRSPAAHLEDAYDRNANTTKDFSTFRQEIYR
jgi:hypothetical protein